MSLIKPALEAGLNLALLTTIVVNIFVFRERHRNRLRDLSGESVDFWIRSPVIKGLDDFTKAMREGRFQDANQIQFAITNQLLELEKYYPVISRSYHNDLQVIVAIMTNIADLINGLDNGIPSFISPKPSDTELKSQLELEITATRYAFQTLVSKIKEEIKTSDLVILGWLWGKYNPLRNAVPK